jgi:secreted trypsin-like serine protease
MMAGLVDFSNKQIFCGTTVIATRYTLSAAHCLLNKQTASTGVLVGDHDIYSGT